MNKKTILKTFLIGAMTIVVTIGQVSADRACICCAKDTKNDKIYAIGWSRAAPTQSASVDSQEKCREIVTRWNKKPQPGVTWEAIACTAQALEDQKTHSSTSEDSSASSCF